MDLENVDLGTKEIQNVSMSGLEKVYGNASYEKAMHGFQKFSNAQINLPGDFMFP